MILSEMGRYFISSRDPLIATHAFWDTAAGSPRTRALASLDITHEQLATYTADMRSFLDHDHPDDDEGGGEGAADSREPRGASPTTSTQADGSVSSVRSIKAYANTNLQTHPFSSPTRKKHRAPTSDRDTASSKTEAPNSGEGSSKAESSTAHTRATSSVPEESDRSEKSKPKLKIKLLPPNASNKQSNASSSAEPAIPDHAKVI